MKNLSIYTDGACSFNPGPGGWGAVLIYNDVEKRISGFVPDTTNNRMELMAVIKALELLKEPCYVELYTDSAYIFNAFTQNWIASWAAKNWRTADRKPVQNLDLWKQLIMLCNIHTISWNKVKGHSDNYYNNICDELARNEIQKNMQ